MVDLLAIAILSDKNLAVRLKELVENENRCLADVLAHIAEFDRRRLHEPNGYPSCFVYCTKVLGYSEDAAYKRITAARLTPKYPAILSKIESGVLSLATVLILGPHLTPENYSSLLDAAAGKTRFEVEKLVAAMAPSPDQEDHIRRLPETMPEKSAGLAAEMPDSGPELQLPDPLYKRQNIHPLAPQRVRFTFTGSEQLLNLLRRAQEVLKAKYPAGDLELIFQESLELLLDKKDPDRRIKAQDESLKQGHPARSARAQSVWAFAERRIPQKVKDEVWRRDGGRCVFVAPDGLRCLERGGLEFDHIVPFGLGGPSNNPKNIRLLCRAHNQMQARAVFGFEKCRRPSA